MGATHVTTLLCKIYPEKTGGVIHEKICLDHRS